MSISNYKEIQEKKNRFGLGFWDYVEKSNNGCWNWTGSGSGVMGYGRIMVDGKRHKAHQLSWAAANGDIPEGMSVCHKCDNPKCVNPAHLFIGTHADNMRDAIAKNRTNIGRVGYFSGAYTGLRGEKNPKSKLKISDVSEIRESAIPAPLLAKKFGVTRETIYSIRSGKTWQ